jgi:hypothetical protein
MVSSYSRTRSIVSYIHNNCSLFGSITSPLVSPGRAAPRQRRAKSKDAARGRCRRIDASQSTRRSKAAHTRDAAGLDGRYGPPGAAHPALTVAPFDRTDAESRSRRLTPVCAVLDTLNRLFQNAPL